MSVSQQKAGTATPEQILRAVQALALTPAFSLEASALAQRMDVEAFTPGQFVDYNGNSFTISMEDTSLGNPVLWLPTSFKKVDLTQQLRPIGPYPLLQLWMQAGRVATDGAGHQMILDQGGIIGWEHTLEAIVVTGNSNPTIASRSAAALSEALTRLIQRNPSLGGIVRMIVPDGDAEPGGEVENVRAGTLSGVLQRYSVLTLQTID